MPTVLVAGANRGIGLEFARQYAGNGWEVIATARRPDEAGEMRGIDGVEALALDIASDQSIDMFMESLGDRAVDLHIANAGMGGWDHNERSAIANVINVNAIGATLLARRLTENVKAGEAKKMVAISSNVGSIGATSSGGGLAYRMSKAAMNMAFKSLSIDWAQAGIATMMLHPGWVQTDMGGSNANITTKESVSGMRALIEAMSLDNNAEFRAYDGRYLEW